MTHITSRRSQSVRLPVPGGSPQEVARVVNALVDGHSSNHGSVTLEAGTTSTEVRAAIFSTQTILILVPLSEDAASIKWWQLEAQTDKRAITLGHDSPVGGVEFLWVAVG